MKKLTFNQKLALEKLVNDPNFDKPLSEVFAPKHQPFVGKFWNNLSLN